MILNMPVFDFINIYIIWLIPVIISIIMALQPEDKDETEPERKNVS